MSTREVAIRQMQKQKQQINISKHNSTVPVPAVTLPVGLGYTVTRKRLLTRASKVSRISVVDTGSGDIWATYDVEKNDDK